MTGGSIPARLPHGYYLEPTLFADVDNRMRIAQEETRAGARRRSRTTATTTRCASPTSGATVSAVRCIPPARERASCKWHAACAPARSTSTPATHSTRTRHLAATSGAASAARWDARGSWSTCETKSDRAARMSCVTRRTRSMIVDGRRRATSVSRPRARSCSAARASRCSAARVPARSGCGRERSARALPRSPVDITRRDDTRGNDRLDRPRAAAASTGSVNNAGISHAGRIESCMPAEVAEQVDGQLHRGRACLPDRHTAPASRRAADASSMSRRRRCTDHGLRAPVDLLGDQGRARALRQGVARRGARRRHRGDDLRARQHATSFGAHWDAEATAARRMPNGSSTARTGPA